MTAVDETVESPHSTRPSLPEKRRNTYEKEANRALSEGEGCYESGNKAEDF
jgi:hypothetical protein